MTEQQEEARAAVTDQAMADETTQKLLEQAEKDAESADADESMVDTQALTESAGIRRRICKLHPDGSDRRYPGSTCSIPAR